MTLSRYLTILLSMLMLLMSAMAPVNAKVASGAVTLVGDSYRASPLLEAKWHQGCGTFKVRCDSGGQYTQQDPIGLDGGTLLNQYVGDPVGWVDPLGLQGVCPKVGTATVTKHQPTDANRFGHYTVQVKNSSGVKHTHQVRTSNDGSTTTIVDAKQYPASLPVVKTSSVKLPNAQKAIDYQKNIEMKELGPYNLKTNSCVTHVCDVLRKGGVDVPKSALGEMKFLKSLGF